MAELQVDTNDMNRLLAALPADQWRRLRRDLELISLTVGQILHEPQETIPYAYFPCGGLISLVTPLGVDKTVEVALIGREGMVGLPVFLGGVDAPFRAVVHGSGPAFRLPADALRKTVRRSRPLTDLLMHYVDAFLVQVAQTAACRSLHPLARRYCCWLLMAHDRMGSNHLPFTQKLLARMMAVRLASATEAASGLRKAGLIRYTRGGIHILDRLGLEAACCSCYRVIKDRFNRLST